MFVQSVVLSLALVQGIAAEYWEKFNSSVDPPNITLPNIAQTTSYDPITECTWYEPPSTFKFDPAEWPTSWEVATSNGMNASAEFKALYASINWNNAPNISVRKLKDGAPDMSDYDMTNDPDCWWSATTCTEPKHADTNPDIYSCPEPETWGLTFDDGPNCSHNAFYDYLSEQKLKATMFYIGSNVINWPYGAMRGVRDGHHIAQHTWSHNLMTTLTNEEVLAELYYTQKAIKMVTGVTPRYWRPAFGDVDDRVRWIATQLNLTTILWDLDTDDWAAGTSQPVSAIEQNYEDFITMGTNGTFNSSGNIVLMHEINNNTMSLAMKYLPRIQTAYKHVVDVATCMNITYPYMEKTVSFAGFNNNTSTSSNSTSNTTITTTSATTGQATGAASSTAAAAGSSTASAEGQAAASETPDSAAGDFTPNILSSVAVVAVAAVAQVLL